MPSDPIDDPATGILYRMAYGIARDWRDRRPITVFKDDPTPAEVAELVAAAKRRLTGPVVDENLIREAIADALAGRRPRW